MKKLLQTIWAIIVIPALLLPGTGIAETADQSTIQLPDIVVTATKTEKELSKAPGSISLVTEDDIENRNIRTIDESLNTLPGVFSFQRSIMDYGGQITLRGIPYGSGKTLILMDGVTPLANPTFGSIMGFKPLAPESVQKVEVVKGPFSSLYGGQAMGGVVNIISKMPKKREIIAKTGYGTSWDSGNAADGLFKYYTSYGDKLSDKLSTFISIGGKDTDGYPWMYNIQRTAPPAGISGWSNTKDQKGSSRYLIGDMGDAEYWDYNLNLKAQYEFSESSKLSLSFFRTRYELHYGNPNTYLRDASGNPVWSYGSVSSSSFFTYQDTNQESNFSNIVYETNISDVKAKLSASYVDTTSNMAVPGTASTISDGAGSEWDHPLEKQYDLDAQFTFPFFNKNLLTFGLHHQYNVGQVVEYNRTNWRSMLTRTSLISEKKGKSRSYALFLQDEIAISDNLTAYLGFREDWWETFDGYIYEAGSPTNYDSKEFSSFNPKASLVYNFSEKTSFKASAGKSFRAPTILELYSKWTTPGTGVVYAGNPALTPETVKSWDLGVQQRLWKGANFNATYFENYMDDLIYRSMTTSTLYENKNVGKAESKGIELEIKQNFDNRLSLFANYTYTESEITENSANPSTVGKNLTMVPENMFNIGATLTQGPFSGTIIGRYVDKSYKNDDNSDFYEGVYGSYDSYFVTDAKISYDIFKHATLSFSVDNIFDKEYFSYEKASGRSWFAEVTVKF